MGSKQHLALLCSPVWKSPTAHSLLTSIRVLSIRCQTAGMMNMCHRNAYLEFLHCNGSDMTSQSTLGIETPSGLCWTENHKLLSSIPSDVKGVYNASDKTDIIQQIRMCDPCLADLSSSEDRIVRTAPSIDNTIVLKISNISAFDFGIRPLVYRARYTFTAPKTFSDDALSGESDEVKCAWLWVKRMYRIREESNFDLHATFNGVKHAVQKVKCIDEIEDIAHSCDNSKIGPAPYPNLHERQLALAICGWSSSTDPNVIYDTISSQVSDIERRAALVIFHGCFSKGLEILASIKDRIDLCAIAAALSSLGSDRKATWYKMVQTLMSGSSMGAYIKWILEFVTDDDNSLFNSMKADDYGEGIQLMDLAGFACRFYTNAQLHEFIDIKFRLAVRRGRLDAIFLSGLSDDGVELIQSYVDRTNDCQTAAFFGTLAQYSRGSARMIVHRNNLVANWIECYRNSLDRRMLWLDRANFDCRTGSPSLVMDEMVGIVCSYCGKSATRTTQITQTGVPPKPNLFKRVTTCSTCKRPLPRCILCKLPMCSSGNCFSSIEGSKMLDWFSWCLSCRHGGHLVHLNKWFSEHEQCPILGCSCRCALLDGYDKQKLLRS